MSTFDRNWRELQLETLVDLSLAIGGLRPEEELVEELLQRAVGTLDARAGCVATQHESGQESVVRSQGLPSSLPEVRALFSEEQLDSLSESDVVRVSRSGDGDHELLAAPMLWQQQLLGVVLLADKETRFGKVQFSESDARFLLSLATMGAAAVMTSRTVAAIERDRQRLAEENRELREAVQRQGFVGESQAIRRVLELVRRVAPTEVNVMIRGESGVGKERIAELMHSLSDRAEGPFVPLNCAALPESLLEAELFGIEEGVATGVQRRLGKLELAAGGTLFLDEVGDLTLPLQAKILRVVQERELERLGGRERIPINIRLVTATNRRLEEMVEAGTFRQDLYYRLRVVVMTLPALRQRRSDIPLLVRHFMQVYGERFGRPGLRVSRQALSKLMNYSWPGNVRELENVVQAAVALAPSEVIVEDDIDLSQSTTQSAQAELLSLEELERRHIEHVLKVVGGNRQAAAGILGIDRSTLYRKMKRDATSSGQLQHPADLIQN